MVSPCPPVTEAGRGGQVLPASRLSPGASPRPTGPQASWSLATVVHRSLGPSRCGLGLGHHGTRGQGCQEPSGAGGGPAASPGGRGKCYFCLLLSSGTGCPGRGGQRRPLRLGPAHREFLKDAHGCREDGRRGRGGWAGPPNPPAGRGGWPGGRGRRKQERLATQRPARGGRREPAGPSPAQAPALPVDGWRGPGRHVAGRRPGRLLRESRRPGLTPGIEAALFPRRALQRSRRRPAPQLCSPGQAESPHPNSSLAGPWREPILAKALGGCSVAAEAVVTGLNLALCPTGHLTQGKPRCLSQPQFPHL